MFSLDVPFIPDGEYPDFLAAHAHTITSVHFSLHDSSVADARQLMDKRDSDEIIAGLKKLEGTDTFVLMNTRLHAPDKYFNATSLFKTAQRLEVLLDSAALRGIVFADPYFIQAFSDAHPDVAAKLEAIPSVNAILDSADKAFSMLSMLKGTVFKSPSRLVLDRSLNRDIRRLKETSSQLRKAHPTIKLYLIANEGCLFQCPYKPAHDAHVALVNENLCGERTFAMNRDFGCVRRLLTDPGAMLASPFIRPEDVEKYAPYIDGIKICGRTKGAEFLKRTISGYIDRNYHGNLLNIMDAMGDLADQVDIPNDTLPKNFAERVTTCDKNCQACGWCTTIMNEISQRTAPGLTTFHG